MELFVLLLSATLAFADNSAIEEFTKSTNAFSKSIYSQLAKSANGNFLVSPFSAETILTFAQSGCRGDTAEELRLALHLPNDRNQIESAIKKLLLKFKNNEFYSLKTANKMYVTEDFSIKDEFKNSASLVYQAGIESVDFLKKETPSAINRWVEKQTNNKITNLVSVGDFDEFTRAVLINALYFKANWSTPFLLDLTTKKDFFKNENEKSQVETLQHFEEYFNYYESPELKAQFLELPFQGDEASMVIALPNEKNGLAKLENHLEQVLQPLPFKNQFLNVAIPKFKFESTLDLKEILEKLGVKKVFEEKKADLSGVSGKPGDLYIKKVVQKTFVDLNELGVEAAAATHIQIAVPESLPLDTPKEFAANHPFMFYIKVKDLIIFVGRVTDPVY